MTNGLRSCCREPSGAFDAFGSTERCCDIRVQGLRFKVLSHCTPTTDLIYVEGTMRILHLFGEELLTRAFEKFELELKRIENYRR